MKGPSARDDASASGRSRAAEAPAANDLEQTDDVEPAARTGPFDTFAVPLATVAALAVVAAYLLAPPMGGDLSAQIARADFARQHALLPIDFRWFGGSLTFGYSLWTPVVMAYVGPRLSGAIATVIAVAAFTFLLRRTGAARPALGGVAVAITLGSNLAEGRITFALAVAAGLTALACLYIAGGWQEWRHVLAALFAMLAAAASPISAIFLLIAAAALLARRRWSDSFSLTFCVLPVALMVEIFPDGGHQVFGMNDAIRALIATAIVLVAVPSRFLAIRIGAALGLIMVGVAYFATTPVGSNSARLSLLFAVPVVIAYVSWKWWIDVLVVVAVIVAQTPITFGTLSDAGKPVTHEAYFAPLLDEIARRGPPIGRLEIPELTGHWEAAYAARRMPLARGWLRQTDTKLNDDVFYAQPPTVSSYRAFLDREAVQYVAVAAARATYYGRREVTLINGGLVYLKKAWSNADWTLYTVTNPVPIVASPGKLVSYSSDQIVLTAPANSRVVVRVRDFRWLSVGESHSDSACIEAAGDHIVLHTKGVRTTYTVTSGLWPGWFAHC